ncbi:MAG: fibronectin type III-like domain-contianing protein [Clostridium sp.]
MSASRKKGSPKKQLRAFKKVALAPQETKHVSLCLSKKDFATYNCKNQAFVINEGTYSLWIGTSVKRYFLSIRSHPFPERNRKIINRFRYPKCALSGFTGLVHDRGHQIAVTKHILTV